MGPGNGSWQVSPCVTWLIFPEEDAPCLSAAGPRSKLPLPGKQGTTSPRKAASVDLAPGRSQEGCGQPLGHSVDLGRGGSIREVVSLAPGPSGASTYLASSPYLPPEEASCVVIIQEICVSLQCDWTGEIEA